MNLTEIIIAVIGLIFAILSTKLFPLAKVNMTSAQYSALLMVTKVLGVRCRADIRALVGAK